MKYKLLSAIVIFSLLLIGAYYLFSPRIENTHDKITVTVQPVVEKDVTPTFQTIGTVQAYASVEIRSMVTGPILNAGFQEGDIVEKDQLLFQIDQRPFNAALEQAKAALARDQATLANASAQVERAAPLVNKGYVNKQEFDTLTANMKGAQANVQADLSAIKNAQVNLDYTIIRSPIVGKTGNITYKPGSIIKANDTQALVTINQINPIYVSFAVPQNKLPIVQENLEQGKVTVRAMIGKEIIENGKLTFIDNAVNTTTGTIQLKATFDNEERHLWPGQYVTVEIPLNRIEHAVLVPSLAISTAQKGFYVFVVDNSGIVHQRFVTPGPVVGQETIIESGLKPGENVVTAGQLRIANGQKVNITKGV